MLHLSFVCLVLGSAIALEVKPGTKPYDPVNKPYYRVDDEEFCLSLFNKFMTEYNRKYATEDEKMKRFKIFKENLHEINRKNIRNPLAVFDISHTSDLTSEEFQLRYARCFIPRQLKYDSDNDNNYVDYSGFGRQAPSSFDWRQNIRFPPAKDQGKCGSCWAFSAISNVESQYYLRHSQTVSLSEQQVVDCDKNDRGCGGGNPNSAFAYLQGVSGAESESDYPYTSGPTNQSGACRFDRNKVIAQVVGYEPINLPQISEDDLKGVLYSKGPISIILSHNALLGNHGGIVVDCGNRAPDHAVLLIGYGIENGQQFWIIRNSWGPSLGEQGYFRFAYGNNCLGFKNYAGGVASVA